MLTTSAMQTKNVCKRNKVVLKHTAAAFTWGVEHKGGNLFHTSHVGKSCTVQKAAPAHSSCRLLSTGQAPVSMLRTVPT